MSLVELLLALVILAVLLGLVYPSWQRFLAHQSLRYATAQVASALREGQERAKAERRAYTVTFSANSSSYTVAGVGGGLQHVGELPRGVVATTNLTITFSPFGRPGSSHTVTLQNSAGVGTISVTAAGGVSSQAP
jgi:Tfp pilus assembly protein FimT